MLSIKHLNVKVENKEIIKDFNLQIKPGELHVLVGPNGSGKSTLARTIIEKQIVETPKLGVSTPIFLGFQTPPAVPGVNYITFLRLAYRKQDPLSFYRYLKSKAKLLGVPEDWLSRSLNDNFSGGEKKKMEMLQALVLQPKYAIFDEPDSGVDQQNLKLIIKALRLLQKNGTGIMVITHSKNLIKLLKPVKIHKLPK